MGQFRKGIYAKMISGSLTLNGIVLSLKSNPALDQKEFQLSQSSI